MKKYESTIIINPSIDEEATKATIKKVEDLINKNGKVVSIDDRGNYRLAYPINKKDEGRFVVYSFESEPDAISEIERNYRIEDNIMKFIVIKEQQD